MTTSPERPTWRWQCQTCGTGTVQDRLLGVVADGTAVHRLTCERCGAVSHYDRKPGTTAPMMQNTSNFLWIAGSETPEGSAS